MQRTEPTVAQQTHEVQKLEEKLFRELQLNLQIATNSHILQT